MHRTHTSDYSAGLAILKHDWQARFTLRTEESPEGLSYMLNWLWWTNLLFLGAPEKLRQQLQLGPPNAFHYLNKGCTRYFCSKENDGFIQQNQKSKDHLAKGPISDPLIDDVRNFKIVDQGLQNLGMTDQVRIKLENYFEPRRPSAESYTGSYSLKGDL